MKKQGIKYFILTAVLVIVGIPSCGGSISTPLSIATTDMLGGEAGATYTQGIAASGGSGVYDSWSITSGDLPAGLVLDPASGIISGTSNMAGMYIFTVQVTDSKGNTANQVLSISISEGPRVSTLSLPDGVLNVTYHQTLEAKGGSGVFTSWVINNGTLPVGLSVVPYSGLINGTPSKLGTYNFTVNVTDSFGVVGSADLSITIVQGN